MKSLIKTIQYTLLVILFSIPLYVVSVIFLGNLAHRGGVFTVGNEVFVVIFTNVLFLTASYLALLVMRNKFVQTDSKILPAHVLSILALFAIYSFLNGNLEISYCIYPIVAYVQIRMFLLGKFAKI